MRTPPPVIRSLSRMAAVPPGVKAAALAAKHPPAEGSLFEDHVAGLLTPDEVANPAIVIYNDNCRAAVLATVYAPIDQVNRMAEMLNMQAGTVDQQSAACLFLSARRQGPLQEATFQTPYLRASLNALRMDNVQVGSKPHPCAVP